MNRRLLALALILFALVVLLGSGILIYSLLNSNSPNQPPGTGTATVSTTQAVHSGNGCGVKHNNDGTYAFSWLHVSSDGKIVDQNNCIVHLLGLDSGWLASDSTGGPDAQTIASWKQAIPTNLVRIAYNSYWWNVDIYVPKYKMHFRQLLQNFVKWNEQNGNYVELDTHTQFSWPPCGSDGLTVNVTYCSTEEGPAISPQDHETYLPRAVQGLTDLAKLYANDPAVIFDVWNEPAGLKISQQEYLQDMNARINTVRTYAPRSLVVVFSHGLKQIKSGQLPLYTQPNLVIDFHSYNPNFTANDLLPLVTFCQQHGYGVIVNEYGGTKDTPGEQQAMTDLAKNYSVNLSYFNASNLTGSNAAPIKLNSIGQMVSASYASIFGNTN